MVKNPFRSSVPHRCIMCDFTHKFMRGLNSNGYVVFELLENGSISLVRKKRSGKFVSHVYDRRLLPFINGLISKNQLIRTRHVDVNAGDIKFMEWWALS